MLSILRLNIINTGGNYDTSKPRADFIVNKSLQIKYFV